MSLAQKVSTYCTTRKATPSDIPAIISLGIEALEKDAYQGLVIDRDRVRDMARECVSSACNFAWVVEVDGRVQGAACAFVGPFMFYRRNQANVVQFYCRAPGEGVKLLRELRSWYLSRPGVRGICFTFETKTDPRVLKLIKRVFNTKTELPVMMHIKGSL